VIRRHAAMIAALMVPLEVYGTEPNDSFSASTILASGTLTVGDELALAMVPDTLLGARDSSGSIYLVDDDGSAVGDGRASGLPSVSVNSDTIQFAVSGLGDSVDEGEFLGAHSEQGNFEVFVHVYDSAGAEIDFFSEVSTLEPSLVKDFSYSNVAWDGGTYTVYLDNTVGNSDVDFYTFTGLTPGTLFEARTSDELESGILTYLGWFDSDGELIAADAASGEGGLSVLGGTVPVSGTLTLAVTGLGDDAFVGSHLIPGTYELTLELLEALIAGDFNKDSVVDAADFVMWRKNDGSPSAYALWSMNFGADALASANGDGSTESHVPEPALLSLTTGICFIFTLLFARASTRSKPFTF
jgi:hypothetical protein